MLGSGQEIHPRYLRAIRQTLKDIILPEISSPAGRNAALLCDYILVRMIAALEEIPAVRAAHDARYRDLVEAVEGRAAPADEPLWDLARRLQDAIPSLGAALDAGAPEDAARARRLLAGIAAEDAAFRQDYEAAAKRVDASAEPTPQALLITRDKVQLYLDRRFPGDGIRLASCQQIPGGRSKITVLLAVEPNGRLPDGMVMRIDVPGSAIATTVRDEFPVIEVMYRAGIAAPEPLWVEADPAPLGAPFMVTRRMKGAAAGDLWGAQLVSPTVGLALAEALAGVHRADSRAIWPAAPAQARDAVRQMLDSYEATLREGDSTPSLAMESAYGWLGRNLACIDGPTVAVHGDAHFANLLAEDGRLVCLLDWEFAHPGHPAADLAYCRPYVETIMKWEDFLAHYRDHGGHKVSEDQLRFFGVWGHLRNITFGANMLRDFIAGRVHGIQNLAIAINTRAKLEALLSRTVAAVAARDAGADLPSPALQGGEGGARAAGG
ncbi:MAG TPA: phosphotransferase family protein [Stellaceae bacterium]|nr:phosphotransferase family protein [Stellaceae bacterium]